MNLRSTLTGLYDLSWPTTQSRTNFFTGVQMCTLRATHQAAECAAGAALDQKRVLLHPLLDEQDILGDPEENVSVRHYELVRMHGLCFRHAAPLSKNACQRGWKRHQHHARILLRQWLALARLMSQQTGMLGSSQLE